jgi:ABC-type dipeptide/oligopeptide/nickel transport system permease component
MAAGAAMRRTAIGAVARAIASRLLVAIPMLLGVVLITFFLIRIGTRDASLMLAGPFADEAMLQRIREQLGLDRPIYEQFAIYVTNLLQGDFGRSWISGRPVIDEILPRLAATMDLLLPAFVIGGLAGGAIGIASAFRYGTTFDHTSRFLSLLGFSIPTYWIGLMAIFVFYSVFGIAAAPMGRISMMSFPPPMVTGSIVIDGMLAGDWEVVLDALHHLSLPVTILAIIIAAPILKHSRAIALDVINSDYVTYARACGLPHRVIRRMVVRNSLAPIITLAGSELTGMLAAVSLLELIFAWGGFGQWGLNAILTGDFAAVQGYVTVIALFSICVFLVIDLIVLWLEPRSRS